MRRYEQVYILRPSLSEDAINAVIETANKVITDDAGTVISLDKWGMRKLAYPIKKEPQGYYVLCDFAGTPGAVSEIERKFRIDDAVLKYLTVKLADSISEEEISAAREEAASKAAQAEAEAKAEAEAEPQAESKPAEKPAAEDKAEATSEDGQKGEEAEETEKG